MDIFNEVLPEGVEVKLMPVGARVHLIVRTKRPEPTWLAQYARLAAKVRGERPRRAGGRAVGLSDAELDAALVALVRAQPGHARSHYERVAPRAGGPEASQERKEAAISALLDSGVLRKVMLERPKGRATHYLAVAQDLPADSSRGTITP